MSVTIGTFEDYTAAGATVITPSGGSRLIYVNPDAAGGGDGTTTTPFNTIAAGVAQMRANQPDWLLLRQGKTFSVDMSVTNPFTDINTKAGLSATEPSVLTTYGSGTVNPANPRGTVQEAPAIVQFAHAGTLINPPNFFATIGITFDYPANDFEDGAFTGSADGTPYSVTSARTWLLVEDCAFLGCSLSIQLTDGVVIVRRNKVCRSFSQTGLYIRRAASVLNEENFLYHNGWKPIAMGGARSGGAHNQYGQSSANNETWISRGNLSAWSSHHGFKQRHGGVLTKNVSWRCAEFSEFGGNAAAAGGAFVPGSGSNACEIYENVVVDQGDPGTQSTGISINDCGRALSVHDNIFANALGTPAWVLSCLGESHNVTATNNISISYGSGQILNVGTSNSLEAMVTSTTGMIDPTRDIDSYVAELGLASEAQMLAAMEANRAWNYDATYTAKNMRAYFQQGYGINYKRLEISCAP